MNQWLRIFSAAAEAYRKEAESRNKVDWEKKEHVKASKEEDKARLEKLMKRAGYSSSSSSSERP